MQYIITYVDRTDDVKGGKRRGEKRKRAEYICDPPSNNSNNKERTNPKHGTKTLLKDLLV
jgi:hypothetical protein